MDKKAMRKFQLETLRLFHDLAAQGHYSDAMRVLHTGQQTVEMCNRIVDYKPQPALKLEENHVMG